MQKQVDKQDLINWISQLNDPVILENVKILKESSESDGDWYNEISDAEKAGIERGINDLKAGRTLSNEEFWKRYEGRQ